MMLSGRVAEDCLWNRRVMVVGKLVDSGQFGTQKVDLGM